MGEAEDASPRATPGPLSSANSSTQEPALRGRSCWWPTSLCSPKVLQARRGAGGPGQGAALPLPSTSLLSLPVPMCPLPAPGRAVSIERQVSRDSSPFLTTPIGEAAFKQVLGCGVGVGGVGEGAASQRTRVERRQVQEERSTPHGPHGRGQPCDLEHGPSRVPPAAPCLCAVSVPALMCHISGGGFPGAASQSPAKLSL